MLLKDTPLENAMPSNKHGTAEPDWQALKAYTGGEDPRTLDELEAIAKKRLPQGTWDFYANGADDEKALRRNIAAYDEYVDCFSRRS